MTDRKFFVDLDGVLGDFVGFYEECFGTAPARKMGQPDPKGFFENIRDHGSFYRDMRPTPDCHELWKGVNELHANPIILSGSPVTVPDAPWQKRQWVDKWLGRDVLLIVCRAEQKRHFARAGDVLIDDWEKFRSVWEEMGGIFITHTSAATSLAAARAVFLPTGGADGSGTSLRVDTGVSEEPQDV